MPNTLSAKEVAKMAGTDPKRFRRFIRSQGGGIGQGNRYEFTQSEAKRLVAAFAKANSPKAPDAPKPAISLVSPASGTDA